MLLAGPTASGKSALAMRMAEAMGGTVVNADSMQVYADLRVLTARPSEADEAQVPHALYGHVGGGVRYSTGGWVRDVTHLIEKGGPLVIVGGTGLYFRALERGIAPVPDIPEAISARWRGTWRSDREWHGLLRERDPALAARVDPSDKQRIIRGIEVFEATGRRLSEWQNEPGARPLEGWPLFRLVLEPPRELLRERIAQRFHEMLLDGRAEAEAATLIAMGYDLALPVHKAIGVRELNMALDKVVPRAEAIERAIIATRQYAKRQSTWFRNQMGPEWLRFSTAESAFDAFEEWRGAGGAKRVAGRHGTSP